VSFNEQTIDGVRILTAPLPGMDALDLIPELIAALGPGGGLAQSGQGTIGEGLGEIGKALAGGKLTGLLARILAGTTMVVPGATDGKYELGKGRPEINRALAARPEMLVPMIKIALEVSFKRFLGGFALAGFDLAAIQRRFRSEDSSPSTSGTGSSTD
jgi:hypothetical protein